jgi:hypothetical protein
MTTVRITVLILIGIVVGSLTRPVQGQSDAVLFGPGQRLTLSYGDRTVHCTVLETRGAFVRCDDGKPDPFNRFTPSISWHNIATVTSVSVWESQR